MPVLTPQAMSAAVPSTVPFGQEQALAIFSGGQDSATCLAWTLSRFQRVLTPLALTTASATAWN